MRYIFKPKNQEKDVCIETTPSGLVLLKNEQEIEIPYAAINKVKLEKYRNDFFVEIEAGHFGVIQVNSCTYTSEKQRVDQSRQYHTFVRIFHYHLLKSQCPAAFVTQLRQSDLGIKFLILIALTLLVYFFEDYTDFAPFSSFTVTVSILLLGMIFLLIPYFTKRPQNYHPSDIPLEMLPPAA
jgi:hypothetical protein